MKASALFRSIIIGHRFQDGNKRTAVVAAGMTKDFECNHQAIIDCALNVAKGIIREVDEIASILYPKSFRL